MIKYRGLEELVFGPTHEGDAKIARSAEGVLTLTGKLEGSDQRIGFKQNPSAISNTFGGRMFYDGSEYSSIFGVVDEDDAGISVTSTGGALAGFLAQIEDAGIKTNANDDLACFAGRINATVAQTLGNWHGLNLYMRNSDQTLTNEVIGTGIEAYIGSAGSMKTLRGAWYDFLEMAASPPVRDWIMCGGQLTLATGGSGNVTGFYFNNNSGADHATYGVWIRGRQLYGVNLRDVTLDTSPGSFDLALRGNTGILSGAGAPGTVLSGHDTGRGKGTLYVDTTNGRLYMNTGTAASPTWQYFSTLT